METYKITLRDKKGYTRTFNNDYEDGYGEKHVVFHWTEGNYSCDCNRSLFLYEWDDEKALPCNEGDNEIELVEIKRI